MPITTPWTTQNCTLENFGSPPASLGNGTAEFRSRRHDGAFEWMFRFIVGSTTAVGTGRWCFFVGLPQEVLLDFTLEMPGAALARDASTAGAGVPGTAHLTWGYNWSLFEEPEPEIYAQEFITALVCHFGTARVGASTPYPWAVGDSIRAAGVLEAFDN